MEISYRIAGSGDIEVLTELSMLLYTPEHINEVVTYEEIYESNKDDLENPEMAMFLALDGDDTVGFAHTALRTDYVEGTNGGTIGYLEGLYVSPDYRGRGIARSLVALCEKWAAENGCAEFASDCLLHNTDSLAFHLKIGFTEANRIICFTKKLREDNTNITIRVITENKKDFLPLLLLGDEQEDQIDKYLECGELFALYDGDLKCICVVTDEGNGTLEIQNLATDERYQRQGYASRLIEYIAEYYAERHEKIILGTGDVPNILAFYNHRGFAETHRIANYFTTHYDHPIIDNGVLLKDKVYLERKL
jgi:GNAT superfamily N-acetyltransferase